jgi:hypothetical protein
MILILFMKEIQRFWSLFQEHDLMCVYSNEQIGIYCMRILYDGAGGVVGWKPEIPCRAEQFDFWVEASDLFWFNTDVSRYVLWHDESEIIKCERAGLTRYSMCDPLCYIDNRMEFLHKKGCVVNCKKKKGKNIVNVFKLIELSSSFK